MSEDDGTISVHDDEDSMIKYLREKIIGRPAVFSRAGDLPSDDNLPPIKRISSQSSLNDALSVSSVSNDTTITDRTTSQVEKFTAAGGSGISFGRRPLSSSSPIIIPKKPPRSNASSQSSSSYTSVVDQMSSLGESTTQSRRESDDVPNTTLPILPSTGQQLEHSAARDRISVKNKRRQPLKQKLSTLRETEDNENNLFASATEAISSAPEDEQTIAVATRVEPKVQQPLIDLSDLDTARARLRMSVRPRDRSADNILLVKTTNTNNETSSIPPAIAPTFNSPMQRSVSFKRPQEMNQTKLINRPIFKPKKEENNNNEIPDKPIENNSATVDLPLHNENLDEQTKINNPSPTQSMSRSSSQEHIYDNLDVFKRPKTNTNLSSNEDEPSTTVAVKTREHSTPATRLRPVTMLMPANNDKETINEFENVFNQLKKRGSIRRVRPNEETTPPPQQPEPAPVKETPTPFQPENEPTVPPPVISTNKTVEPTPMPQTPNRRKTVGGVHLPASNKVATDDNKPTPSWMNIAKQKQAKFQPDSSEKSQQDESEPQQSSIEPPVAIRKQVPSVDIRSNRKSMFEQPTTQTNTHVIERDSIRALKAGNPNRINNLIQFFDK